MSKVVTETKQSINESYDVIWRSDKSWAGFRLVYFPLRSLSDEIVYKFEDWITRSFQVLEFLRFYISHWSLRSFGSRG